MTKLILISVDNTIDAISTGIDRFIKFANIQSNQNPVSSTASHILQAASLHIVKTREIYDAEIQSANKKKMQIRALRDEAEKISFIQSLGHRFYKNLSNKTTGRKAITSHYGFIALSIIYTSSIMHIDDNRRSSLSKGNSLLSNSNVSESSGWNTYSFLSFNSTEHFDSNEEVFGFSTETLINSYLTPNTRAKGFDGMYNIVSELLIKPEFLYKTKLENNTIDPIDYSNFDKLGILICASQIFPDEDVRLLFSEEQIEKYKSMKSKAETHKRTIDSIRPINNLELNRDIKEEIRQNYNMTISTIKSISNMVFALKEYINKFDENTNSTFKNYMISSSIDSVTSPYNNKYESDLKEKGVSILSEVITNNTVKAFFPPSIIIDSISNIINLIISITSKSKGYGVINRHGVTGQIRANLFISHLELLVAYIKNQFIYFTEQSGNNKHSNLHGLNLLLGNSIMQFYNAYDKQIKKLPNHGKKGSLYFYLKMFNKESEYDNKYINKEYGRDDLAFQKWIKAKGLDYQTLAKLGGSVTNSVSAFNRGL